MTKEYLEVWGKSCCTCKHSKDLNIDSAYDCMKGIKDTCHIDSGWESKEVQNG